MVVVRVVVVVRVLLLVGPKRLAATRTGRGRPRRRAAKWPNPGSGAPTDGIAGGVGVSPPG